MSQSTGIEWTDATWNPVRGCSRVSPGCENCYAERVAARFSGPGLPYEGLARMTKSGPRWTGRVRLVEEHLEDPLRWRRPSRIFVNSMSDLFHEALEDDDRDAIFAIMALAQQHTFQVLTKRPGEMRAYFEDGARERVEDVLLSPNNATRRPWPRLRRAMPWPLPNVWLGVSVEDQRRADERIPALLRTPAALRFLSVEPLLGPVQLCAGCPGCPNDCGWAGPTQINWVIVGGESGPGARPMHPDWARSLRDQCRSACVPFFFKQWGAWGPVAPPRVVPSVLMRDGRLVEFTEDAMKTADRERPLSGATAMYRIGKRAAGRLLDGRTWDEFPEVPDVR